MRGIVMAALLLTAAAWAQFDPAAVPQGTFAQALQPWQAAYGRPVWDGEVGHGAPGCVRLVDAGAVWSPMIPVGDEFIQLTAWMKTQDIVRGTEPWHQATVQVSYFDKDTKSLGHFDPGGTVGTTDWMKVESLIHFEPRQGVASFQVGLMNWNCTGTSWFDDVELRQAETPLAYKLCPALAQVENQLPRTWPVLKLGAARTELQTDVLQVQAAGQFLTRRDGKGVGISRMSVQNQPLSNWRVQIDRGYMTRLAAMPAGEGPPQPDKPEAYLEAFRGSPVLYGYFREWLPNGVPPRSREASLDLVAEAQPLELWGFEGNRLTRAAAGKLTLNETTTKPFVIVRRPDDSGGLVIYHPIPAEVRRWYVEDYVVEAEPPVEVTLENDRLRYRLRDVGAQDGGAIHSLDFHYFMMPYDGPLAAAMAEFSTSDIDLLADAPPLGDATRGYWQPFMGLAGGQRPLMMARYFPREFCSHMSTGSWDYGHEGGHGWGCTTASMKNSRVNPLATTALMRDNALRMLTFFVQYAGPYGAPSNVYTWRAECARLGNPKYFYNWVFCQYWEWRLGEFRTLLSESPLLTKPEKERVYRDLQRARRIFDPRNPDSWTRVVGDGGYWFNYINLPPGRENDFVINTHLTSLANVGELAILAREQGQKQDEAFWTDVFKRGIDGTLWACGQDFMWADYDENEILYGGVRGGPQGYARYCVSEWLPHVLRLNVQVGLEHRLDELVALELRMMQARYVQEAPQTVKYGQDGLDWVAANRKR